MSRKRNLDVITDRLDAQPVVRAWTALHPDLHKPVAIEPIRSPDSSKCHVVRLVGSGINGSSVIAKKADPSTAMVEVPIYEQVLCHQSIKTIQYYGSAHDEDASFVWIFTEDAGTQSFSFKNELHASLAIEWLAELHASVPRLVCVPDRGIGYYHERLLSGHQRILLNLSNPALNQEDTVMLESIVSNFELLKERWSRVLACYEHLPKCFIHGDFKPKNLRVRSDGPRHELLVFDWEMAGWGSPGIDMWKLNVQDYWLNIREHWPAFSLEDAVSLQSLGKLLRSLHALDWESMSLPYAWLDRSLAHMKIYNMRLSSAIRDLAVQ